MKEDAATEREVLQDSQDQHIAACSTQQQRPFFAHVCLNGVLAGKKIELVVAFHSGIFKMEWHSIINLLSTKWLDFKGSFYGSTSIFSTLMTIQHLENSSRN